MGGDSSEGAGSAVVLRELIPKSGQRVYPYKRRLVHSYSYIRRGRTAPPAQGVVRASQSPAF